MVRIFISSKNFVIDLLVLLSTFFTRKTANDIGVGIFVRHKQ